MISFYSNRFQIPSRVLYPGAALGMVLLGFMILQNLRFHLVSTTPSLGVVRIITSSISFNYNHGLSTTGLSVTSGSKIIDSYRVSGKSLIVNLKPSALSVGKTYTVVIGPLSDVSDKKLAQRSFTFKVNSVSFQNLSKAQQDVVMQQQAAVPYTRTSINYDGINVLVDAGLSADQVQEMKQAFFLYSQSINKKFSQITVIASSVVQAPYDSNSATQTSSVSFNVNVDAKTLGAKLVYTGLLTAELYLYDAPGGALIYDSGNLTPTSN